MLWLYDEFETDFRYNGIVLNNAYDSDIHWVLNTSYKLTFKYPTVDNDMYSLIEKGMMIKAEESDRTNLFRIKDIDINENDKCITVTAYHYLYDFNKRLINNFSRINVDATSMLNEWYLNFTSKEKDFSYYSDIQRTNSYTTFSDEKDSSLKNSFAVLGDIANIYNADIDMHDKQLSLLEKLGKDTEEVLTTAKNISEFVNTSNADEIVTRLYVTSTFRLGTQDDKDKLKEQHRKELEALRRSQKEYTAQENKKKKQQQIKDEINKKYAKELAKQNKTLKRSSVAYKTYDQIVAEVNSKYNKREETANYNKRISQQKADARKKEIEDLKARQKDEAATLDEEITISLVVESPLINDYPFINEIAISNNELRTAEELEEWATKYFTEQNIDKPKNSIKVSYEQLSEKVNRGDTVILKYLKYNIDERIRIVETHYDPMLKKWKEFVLGEKEGHLGSEISNASSGAEARANAYTDKIYSDFGRRVQEESENFTKVFNKKNEEYIKELNDNIERAKAKAEEDNNKIATDIETKLDTVRSDLMKNMNTLDASIDEAKKDLTANRLKLDDSIRTFTADINELKTRDFPNVDELRKIAEDAKASGVNATKKVTELENSVKTELTNVKNNTITKTEYKTGVDGLSAKISALEEYKNSDISRTQILKNWVQQDTADKLARERTEVTKIIDGKGFVKDTQFSSKFEENARGIMRQLTELNAYKNEDGSRQESLKKFVKTETASQLATERASINQYINEKGFGTVEFINQKVKETSDSFSRDIAKVNGDVSSITSWKQTTEGTLLSYKTELNNYVKYRDITINDNGIAIGAGNSYKFDGKRLASMINVNPDVVSVITNKMVVGNFNNLVSGDFRKAALSNSRYTWITPSFEDEIKDGDEFIIKFKLAEEYAFTNNFGVALTIDQVNNPTVWITKVFFKPNEAFLGNIEFTGVLVVKDIKTPTKYYFSIFQDSRDTFDKIKVKDLKIYKKQSAELIVDGSIEGKHIKAGSMETGHFKAGSVTTDILAADAVTADKLKVDKAFIDKLAVNEALIKKLTAQQAFINKLNGITITGEQITGGVIDGVDIGASSKFRIGRYGSMQPKTYGMQINAPKSESANGGITVQIYGDSQEQKKYQEGGVTYTPLGVYVYRDDNFRIGGVSKDTTSYIMHVRGYIAAKGINNLGVVNYGQDVALRIWNNTLEFYMSYAANTFYLRWPKNRNGVEEKYNLWSVATWAINHGASDIRLKENIRDTSLSALDDINKFKFKSFEWKEQGMYSRPTVDIGVIAQEVEQIDKNFVQELDGVKNLNLANLLTFNLKATQELYRNQLSQDEKILQLENKIKQLEAIING